MQLLEVEGARAAVAHSWRCHCLTVSDQLHQRSGDNPPRWWTAANATYPVCLPRSLATRHPGRGRLSRT